MNARFVLMSVTEGEDKHLKYPTIFNSADFAVITKTDLAEAVGFDMAAVERNLQAVRLGIRVFYVSAKNGQGMAAFVEFLKSQLQQLRGIRHHVSGNQSSNEPVCNALEHGQK